MTEVAPCLAAKLDVVLQLVVRVVRDGVADSIQDRSIVRNSALLRQDTIGNLGRSHDLLHALL